MRNQVVRMLLPRLELLRRQLGELNSAAFWPWLDRIHLCRLGGLNLELRTLFIQFPLFDNIRFYCRLLLG